MKPAVCALVTILAAATAGCGRSSSDNELMRRVAQAEAAAARAEAAAAKAEEAASRASAGGGGFDDEPVVIEEDVGPDDAAPELDPDPVE